MTYYSSFKNQKLVSYTQALQKMTSYCAYQERCHVEVEMKLKEYKLIPEAREKILLYLMEEDFLNETRFAESFARGKFAFKKWGRLRIINELKLRKISDYNIKKALKQINDSVYYESFDTWSEQKWDSLSNELIHKAKQKFINYFRYRGWENSLIFEKLTELEKQHG